MSDIGHSNYFIYFCDSYWHSMLKIITGLNDRISQQKCSKTQNFICSNFVQKWIKITFRSQRSPEKSFLVISEHFWTKIEFWKKKSQNFARITQKRVIFEISIVGFWSGSADNRPICYERVRLGRKSSQNCFWDYISKIHDFIQKS